MTPGVVFSLCRIGIFLQACGSQVSGSREASPSSSKLSKAGGSITPQSAAAAAAAAGAAAGTVLSDEQAAEQDEAEVRALRGSKGQGALCDDHNHLSVVADGRRQTYA